MPRLLSAVVFVMQLQRSGITCLPPSGTYEISIDLDQCLKNIFLNTSLVRKTIRTLAVYRLGPVQLFLYNCYLTHLWVISYKPCPFALICNCNFVHSCQLSLTLATVVNCICITSLCALYLQSKFKVYGCYCKNVFSLY